MAHATLPLALLALACALAPAASAVTVCIGTGELCVKATATPRATTDADTATVSYETSSTAAPQANVASSETCGAILSSGASTRAGVGCQSRGFREYAYARELSGPAPSTCVGLFAGGGDRLCRGVGASGTCVGLWHGRETQSGPVGQTTACDATGYAGRCVVSSWLVTSTQCAGGSAYEATCPNGDFGTQYSAWWNDDETEVLCVSTGSAARVSPPAHVPAGLLP